MEDLLNTPKCATWCGASYGLAGALKGTGIAGIKHAKLYQTIPSQRNVLVGVAHLVQYVSTTPWGQRFFLRIQHTGNFEVRRKWREKTKISYLQHTFSHRWCAFDFTQHDLMHPRSVTTVAPTYRFAFGTGGKTMRRRQACRFLQVGRVDPAPCKGSVVDLAPSTGSEYPNDTAQFAWCVWSSTLSSHRLNKIEQDFQCLRHTYKSALVISWDQYKKHVQQA